MLCYLTTFVHTSWSGLWVAWITHPVMTADTKVNWLYCVTRQRDGQKRTVLVWKASFILQGWEDASWVPRVMAKFGVPGTQMTISKRSCFWFLSLVFWVVAFPFTSLWILFRNVLGGLKVSIVLQGLPLMFYKFKSHLVAVFLHVGVKSE